MIKALIKKVFGRKPKTAAPIALVGMQTYPGSQLGIDPNGISSAAFKTCEALQAGGFKAYVVGGGVRDAILKLKPKDFDVATNATPDEVRALFRRSRIIGRRFQIVHVIFGRETIETSTFRALQTDALTDEHGRVLRDNQWGSQEDDAARRDFTVNALYYDPIADVVLDYHQGVRDIQSRTLRMIGDPATRYREDPVRMLRVARFAAKLGFTVEPGTRAPVAEMAPLLNNVPSARLFDEMLKLFSSGKALACIDELRAEGLHHGLLPMLDLVLELPEGQRFVEAALKRTDERVAQDKPISPGFLFAALLWPQINARWQKIRAKGLPLYPALMEAIDSVLDEQAEQLAIQRRIVSDMREIWAIQPRFERRTGSTAYRLLEHPRFRASYDFLLLRCESGELDMALGEWWTAFIDADRDEREDLMEQANPRNRPGPGAAPAKKRRRRGGSTGADRGDGSPGDVAAQGEFNGSPEKPD
jgi:poly(A) polymerase